MTEQMESLTEINLPEEFDGLPTFVVGGAVRDELRGEQASDIDLMVAEVTPSEMKERGFREIDSPNNDTFAVFQDSLGREVAIAREEESIDGQDGYKGFEVTPVPADVPANIALRRDLKRRDIRYNSMAVNVGTGELFDPYNGAGDLKLGVIRATNDSTFAEDPLRVIRVARFAARFDHIVDRDTMKLMREAAPGIRALPRERIRKEMIKSFKQAEVQRAFFDTLLDANALLSASPQLWRFTRHEAGPIEYHREGSVYEHTMMVLDEMQELRPNDEVAMLMALMHDYGKVSTDEDDLPGHPNHGMRGYERMDVFADNLSFSNEHTRAMKEAARYHMHFHNIKDLRESTIVEMVQNIRNLSRLIALAVADSRGRSPSKEVDVATIAARLDAAEVAVDEWSGQDLIDEGYSPSQMGGEEFGSLLRQRRVETMREIESDRND